jgi:hypothetical protein
MRHFRIIKGAMSQHELIQKERLRHELIAESAKQYTALKRTHSAADEQLFIEKLKQINYSLTNEHCKDIAKRVEKEILEKYSTSINSFSNLEPNIISGLL